MNQKTIGLLVFIVGLFVASAFGGRIVEVESETPRPAQRLVAWGEVAGLPFLLGLALMIGGGLVARRASKEDEGGGEAAATGTPQEQLRQMQATLDGLDATMLPGNAQGLADQLDAVLSDAVPNFLDGREALIERLGLERFAEMIGSFAVMERNAARAWSAITDEAWAEVPQCIERARTGLKHAIELIEPASE